MTAAAPATPTGGPAPSGGLARSALLGVILGVDAAGLCLALATLCFAVSVPSALGLATTLFLLGSLVSTLVLLRFGGLRPGLSVAQDTAISILAPAVSAAAVAAAAQGPQGAALATGLAVLGLSTLASGLTFWLVGRLGLGRIVRMFPYPVAAGFLASSGYLLVLASLSLLTDTTGPLAILSALDRADVLPRLLPALATTLALVLATRVWSGATPVLVVLFVALAGFYLVAAALGLEREQAVAMGLLPGTGPGGAAGLDWPSLALIDLRALVAALPIIAVVVLINLIGLLLNTSGVELATRSDIDENRELRVTGLANIGIGLTGGLTSYLQGGATVLAHKLQVHPTALVAGHAASLLAATVAAPLLVAQVPTFIPAALLMFIGVAMLQDWLWAVRRRIAQGDWAIVIAIVAATMGLGILPAIAIGLGLAVLGFALTSIRLPILRKASDLAQRRSVLDRSPLEAETLQREGHRALILELQGALFFGSVQQLIAHLRAQTDPGRRAVILDLSGVQSFDSSACAAFDKLSQMLGRAGTSLHLAGAPPGLVQALRRWGLPLAPDAGAAIRLRPGLNEAIEDAETQLLAEFAPAMPQMDVLDSLRRLGRDHPRCGELFALMHRRRLEPGEVLIEASAGAGDIYFVASGRLSVHLPVPAHGALRLRSMLPGAIVGEAAHVTGQPRNADVRADVASEVLCLPTDTLHRIDREDRDMAALVLSILSRALAAKLDQTNALLSHDSTARARLREGPA